MNICASCGREFEADSDSDALCPQCAAESLSMRPVQEAPAAGRLWLQSPTLLLIALNTLVYLAMATIAQAP